MMFWGCMISAVEPFVEKAARFSLERLGVTVEEIPDATCCPDPEISRTLGEEVWLTLAGRNLSLANKAGGDVCVICNGCFDTLTKANSELTTDQTMNQRVNTAIAKYGTKYDGSSRIFHVIELLHDIVGLEAIKEELDRSLSGLRCAPQYGCRILREDLNLAPKFDSLITTLGGELVHTKTERLCCGVPAMYADPDFSLHQRTEVKLKEIKESQAECIILFCPACAERIERAEVTLRKEGRDFEIPVVNYLELLALCLGASSTDIGAHLHRVSIDPIVERIMKAP
jgi:heterodisulfide reductase subunit B